MTTERGRGGGRRPGGGRARPLSTGLERYAWFFMRLSGVVLLVLAVFHLMWMHFAIGVENIDFQTVVNRWRNPLWRLYDLGLLAFALSHGTNGLRSILDEVLDSPGWRLTAKSLLFLVAFALASAGAYVIFTFDAAAA